MSRGLSDSIKSIVDVSEEKESNLKKKLEKIADRNKAVLMACIAPYVGKRVSPTRVLTAELGISEEFAIETSIEQIREKTDAEQLYLLLNSPGGYVSSSYKVAKALRSNFKRIKVFVPHIAASGGTLIALTGNEIVMGMMSQLSPVDPWGSMGGRRTSSKSLVDGFNTVTEFFKRTSEEDAPYTYKVLAKKYDADRLDEAISALMLMKDYLMEILKGSGYKKDKVSEIAEKLVRGFRNHTEVINSDKAQALGLRIIMNDKCSEEWGTMREWLGEYLLKSTDRHIIRFAISQSLLKQKPTPQKKVKINASKPK